jgi:hypothetical protein
MVLKTIVRVGVRQKSNAKIGLMSYNPTPVTLVPHPAHPRDAAITTVIGSGIEEPRTVHNALVAIAAVAAAQAETVMSVPLVA